MGILLNNIKPAQGPSAQGPSTHGPHVPHLVIQRELAECWDVLGPLHEHQQLLLHGLAHVRDAGDLLRPDVAVDPGDRGGDLGAEEGKCWGRLGPPTPSEPCTEAPPQTVSLPGKGGWMGCACPLGSGGSARENGQREEAEEGRQEGGGPSGPSPAARPAFSPASSLESQGTPQPSGRGRAKMIVLI